KQITAYEISACLVASETCIRDTYKDLEPELLGRVEELIDFVTDSGGA
ncbi:DUF3097 family protein, partial [Streptomyces scabiei]